MAMTLVVMAAGKGSRFGGMKQVAEIGPSGEALFDYAVYDAARAGFERAVFVVSEESQGAIRAQVEKGCGRHVEVRYVLQGSDGRPKPWGTGHAVLCACREVDGPFGVVNADDFYGRRSFELLGQELGGSGAGPVDHRCIAFHLRETLSPNGGVSRGLCEVDDGILTSIVELHEVQETEGRVTCREGLDLTGDELISANLWGFQLSFCSVLAAEFDHFVADRGDDHSAEFMIGDAVDVLERYGDERVRVVPTPERFLGITYAADVASVRENVAALVADGRYPSPLWG